MSGECGDSANGALFFRLLRRLIAGFVDPSGRIAGGEGFFGGFLDGVERGIGRLLIHGAVGICWIFLLCWLRHGGNDSSCRVDVGIQRNVDIFEA